MDLSMNKTLYLQLSIIECEAEIHSTYTSVKYLRHNGKTLAGWTRLSLMTYIIWEVFLLPPV